MMVKNGVSPRKWWFEWDLPGLVNIQKTMKNHDFEWGNQWKSTINGNFQ